MRIGSLFSGAGGLDMAVEQVFGGEVIWQSEVDKAASKVLEYRFPCAPNLGDITAIDWKTVEPPDVLCGGFPCQDVSAAGKRAGIKDGTRSGLWSVFADAIDQLQPPLVVIENVRGLLSAQAHRNVEPDEGTMGDRSDRPVLRALGAVLGDLSDLGYDAQWTTFAAADVGAPHRRERVFILAANAESTRAWNNIGRLRGLSEQSVVLADSPRNGWDEGRPESTRIVGGFDAAVSGDEPGVALLPTPCAQQSGNSPEEHLRKKPGRKVVTDLAILVENGLLETGGALLPTPRASDPCGAESRSSERFRPQLGEVVRELCQPHKVVGTKDDGTVPVFAGDDGGDDVVVVASDGDGVAVDVSGSEKGHSSVVAPESADTKCDLLPTPAASDGSRGPDYAATERNSTSYHTMVTLAAINQWGKYEPAIRCWESLTRPAPAPTEPNKNGNPRLSAAFSEWMMGWPAGWVTDPAIGISRNDQLKIVGNGVCPQQAVAALTYLLSIAEVEA